jgi:hypothetical protein
MMDSKTRDEIIRRCEILQHLGDSSIHPCYDQIPPDELMERHGDLLKDDSDLFKLELKLVPREEN